MLAGLERDNGQPTENRTARYGGLRVAAFESRRAEETARLLETAGATAFVSPAMREVPLSQNEAVLTFARQLIAGRYEIVILMTGVGFRFILRALEGEIDVATFLEALGRTTIVARGPKPVAALKDAGLSASVKIGEPNTWRDVLAACAGRAPDIEGASVALQEYGLPNRELQAGLEALGATVNCVPVYEWALPEDVAPLEANLRRIAAGEIDVALFTSSRQVFHILLVAQQLGIEQDLRDAFKRIAVGSIGALTSETLRECGFEVGFEPPHPKLGHLVNEGALRSAAIATKKQV